MSRVIKIRKGLDINLKGKADKVFIKPDRAEKYAMKPVDFPGLVAKLAVREGDKVKAGSPLFFDKNRPDIQFTSPVSGEVTDIVRGERRKLLEIIVQSDQKEEYEQFEQGDPKDLSREKVVENLLKSGLWPTIIQRPYGIIANPEDTPKAIFISAFDKAPLAPDYDFVVKDSEKEFQAGIDALSKLTKGKIHLGINDDYPASKVFTKAKGVEITSFRGPHPAGNVGIHIHHIDPIARGEIAWTVNPQHVISIGRLFLNGTYDLSKVIALAGSEVNRPRYYKLTGGAQITNILKDNVTEGNNRYISGDVLTGSKIARNGYLGFYDSQITVIPEGDYHEFLGWAKPGFNKFSHSHSFFSWLQKDREFTLDTNENGGKRAYVVSGEYEKVLPMDIYPVHLIKAIMVEDIDLMEQLGIYEVIEEDMALCEFVCTSKTDVQQILRDGINMMIKELS